MIVKGLSMFYLYVKCHNKTNLKYLGKTTRNPHKYKGSGLYWKRHIKEHGNDVTTKILGSYSNINELSKDGLYYSKLWNIVESDKWANLIPEHGTDGGGLPGRPKSKEHRDKISKALLGKPRFDLRKPKTKEHKRKISLGQNRPDVLEKKRKAWLGKFWINNGNIEKSSYVLEPGFIKGRL